MEIHNTHFTIPQIMATWVGLEIYAVPVFTLDGMNGVLDYLFIILQLAVTWSLINKG